MNRSNIIATNNNIIHEIAVRLRLHEALCHFNLKNLAAYFDHKIVREQPIKIVAIDETSKIKKQADKTDDFFAKDGAWFKHQKCRKTKYFAKLSVIFLHFINNFQNYEDNEKRNNNGVNPIFFCNYQNGDKKQKNTVGNNVFYIQRSSENCL